MSNKTNQWFQQEEKVKKKRYVTAVPAAVLTRILESAEIYEDRWIRKGLWASDVGDENDIMHEWIQEFWEVGVKKLEPFSESYMRQSTVKHAIIQRFYHASGILHPLHTNEETGEFKEVRATFEDHGISGKIDLIMPDPEYLKYIGAKRDKKEEVKRTSWRIGDIKETSAYQYSEIQDNLNVKYRTQLSLYHRWGVNLGIVKKKDPVFFYYLNRDNPRTFKWIDYYAESELVDSAFRTSDIFWEHIRNKTCPVNGDISEFCFKYIEAQPDREWPELSEIKHK